MKKNLLLVIIVISGFLLRLLSAIYHSYSSDELSAITRLKYDSISDLIEHGVKIGDMHPAGVQIFMKIWSTVFGTSELTMRLPFVLFGTASIWLIYKIGKYYSTETALFSSSLWAVLLFPIIQSELARPYSPGLFFVLMSVLLILKLLFSKGEIKRKWITAIGLSFSIVGCMYTHYFAFLTIAFIAISALFWVKKSVLLPYLFAGLFAIILFLPHFSITLYQIGIDGGIQWLAPPGNWWLFEFIFFAFNNSWFLILSISLFSLIGLVMGLRGKIYLSKYTILFSTWFIGTYLIGHLISHYFTPVLKFPVMIFVLPFFILVLAKTISPVFKLFKGILPFLLILVTLLSTTVEKKLFKPIHYEVLKELSNHIRDWEQKYDEKNILKIINVSDLEYLNFYGKKSGEPHKFALDIINYGDAKLLDSVINSNTKTFLIFGYSGRDTPIQFLNQCLKHFPYLVDIHKYNNSALVLLSKNLKSNNDLLQPIETISLDNSHYNWDFEIGKFSELNRQYYADSTNVYRPQLLLPINKSIREGHFIRVKIKASVDKLNQISIVAEPKNENGESLKDNSGKPIYMGLDIEKDLQISSEASFAFSIPSNMPKNGMLKIYIWNRNKQSFLIESLNVEILDNIWNN